MDHPPRADWERAKEFKNGDIAVTVLRQPMRFPRYALEIGVSFLDQGGQPKTGRRISIQSEGRGDAVTIKSKHDILSGLIKEAEAWILEQVKATEAANQNRPPKKHDGKPQDGKIRQQGPVLGLKALKKRDKAAYEARKAAEEAAKPAEASPEA